MRSGRALAGALAAAVLLAGCGSTANLGAVPSASLAGGSDGGSGLGRPGGGPLPAEGFSAGQLGVERGPAPTGSDRSAAGGTGRLQDRFGPQAGPAAVSRRTAAAPRSAPPVQLGLVTSRDANDAASAFGLSGVNFGHTEAQMREILKDLNARGGLGGRRVELVVHDVRTSDAQSNPSAAAQAACETFTRDNKVLAAVSSLAALNATIVFPSCMAKAGVPLLVGDLAPHSNKDFERFAAALFGLGVLNSDRIGTILADRLVAQRYFTGWDVRRGAPGSAPVKLGILYLQQAPAFKDALIARLRPQGIQPVVFGYNATVSDLPTQMASAQLRFASEGVTHVAIEEGSAALFFLPAAEQQRYRPRYGIQSLDALTTLESALPKEQFVGSIGVGWSQYSDVDQSNDPGDTSRASARCRSMMKAAGDDPSNRTAFFLMAVNCDAVALLETAVQLTGSVTSQGVRVGIERAGGRVASSFTFAVRYGAQRHDGVAAVRDLQYTDRGFAYVGPRLSI